MRGGENMTLFMNEKQLAERWGVSAGTLANLRSAKIGPPYIKINKSVRYPVAAVEEYEQAQLRNAVAA
jgi:hypothetical protein